MIDLHIHSNHSDGTCSISQIIDKVIDANLYAFSITDHDTVNGISDVLSLEVPMGLQFIPGIEFSCDIMNREIHILGYGINWENSILNSHLTSIREGRIKRNQDMIRLFRNHGIKMTMEELQEGNSETVVTRAHFAKYLVDHKICSNRNQAFKKYLGESCKFFIPKPIISPYEIIDIIHNAGGLSFLAHPFLYNFSNTELETLITNLSSYGLDGLEVYHSSHHAGQVQTLKKFQKEYHLLASGGSDFHGDNKPDIKIGIGRNNLYVPDHLYDQIKNELPY